MTEEPKSTFAKRVRAAKPRARKYDVWDDVTSGLGLRVGANGHRSFFLRHTVRDRIRSATIGSADTLTVPETRREARKLLATFIDPARNGNGPRTPSHPMGAFAAEFLDRQAQHCQAPDPGVQHLHGRQVHPPAFGRMTVDAVTVEHVKDRFASMADRPGAANRAMLVLSVMMRMAELWGCRPHNSTPARTPGDTGWSPRSGPVGDGRKLHLLLESAGLALHPASLLLPFNGWLGALCAFLPQPSEPLVVQPPAYVDERVQYFVEHVLKPETAEFVGVTPLFEGSFVFVEDCPQSLADRYWEVRTRWVSYLGKFLCQKLLDCLGQCIMQLCQIVAMRGLATLLVVSDAP